MALVSVSTSKEELLLRIMCTELMYGMASFLGSLFQLYTVGMKQGVLLASMSMALYIFYIMYMHPTDKLDYGKAEASSPTTGMTVSSLCYYSLEGSCMT
ncbi:hypothetical protein SRHO_G00220550 [Serrasalmus rhombeus]